MNTSAERPDGPTASEGHAAGASAADRFRVLAASAPVGIFETDAEGFITYVNDRWRDFSDSRQALPISPGNLLGLLHRDDRDRVGAEMGAAWEARATFDLTCRVVGAAKRVRHLRFEGSPMYDNGDFTGYIGVVMDLTELYEATSARRYSEQRYRDLIEAAPVGQAVYTMRGDLVDVNKAWLDLLGRTRDEVLGTKAVDHVHPEDRGAALELAKRLVDGEFEHSLDERRLVRRDGSPVWVSSSISIERDLDGVPAFFHSLVIDINERKLAEEALRRSETKYRKLIHEAPVPQLIAELDGTLVEFNEAFVRLMHSTPEALRARHPRELIDPQSIPELVECVRVLTAGEADYFETERLLVRPDGSTVWVIGGTSLIVDGGDQYLHTVMQDITDRRNTEVELHDSEARYRAVVDSLHDGLIVHTADAIITSNASALRILGFDPDCELDATAMLEVPVFDADEREVPVAERPSMQSLMTGRPHFDVVQGIHALDGQERWCLTNSIPLFHEGESSPYAVALSFTDITERQLAMRALRDSEVRFRTLAESLPVGVFHADVHAQIDYANPRWLEITDVPADRLADPSTIDIIHPDDRRDLARELAEAFGEHRPYHVQYRIRNRDGSVRWLSGRGARTYDSETNEPTGIVGSIEDVTPLIEAHEQNARLAGIVESTSDLVGIVDWHSGMLAYLNTSARELFGYVDRDITQVHHLELFTDEAATLIATALEGALRERQTWSGELSMRAADGSTVLVWQTIAADYGPDGDITQLSAVGRDVTERRRFEEELAWQASHDAHTRLPNRALLIDHLALALRRSERDHRLVAVAFLDLDRFKLVNDTLGHTYGDQLLVQAADRITQVLRPGDTVARIGGDEFVILADEVDNEEHAVAIARRVASAIDGEPFVLHEQAFNLTASIGIAVARGGDAHPEALLRDADAAMYRAKALGRDRLELFDESMRLRVQRRNEMASQLADGIEDDDITVYYQPCVDLESGVVTSIEALARWQHPERGILSPYEFIALAEDTGMIVGLGLAVLSKACQEAQGWLERLGASAPKVHVNLSGRQLMAANLPALVEGVLLGTGLPAERLCLEITESVLMDDAASVIDTLWALKGIGVSIAIDDFGTGYSSLSYLRRFPVDVLKVDQSFVSGLGPDPEDSAIVAAIVNLAASLELDAVAEGVETLEQLERLRALGCRGAQGFYFSEPVPAGRVDALLAKPFTI